MVKCEGGHSILFKTIISQKKKTKINISENYTSVIVVQYQDLINYYGSCNSVNDRQNYLNNISRKRVKILTEHTETEP